MNIIERAKNSFLYRVMIPYGLIGNKKYYNRRLRYAPAKVMELYGKGDVISDNIAFLGYYEYELSNIIRGLAEKSALMVDVGANMGYFSILFAENTSNGKVIAFEPNPRVNSILKRNIEKNELMHTVTVHEKAVSNITGELHFDFGNENQSGWGHISSKAGNIVKGITLDDFFLNDKSLVIDILKIDVEGHELKVLEGAIHLLKTKRIKNIFFEINNEMLQQNFTKAEDLFIWLSGFGYKTSLIKPDLCHSFVAHNL